jgi:amino acid transporter
MTQSKDAVRQKFGTFGGVFTPCTLTILGVIMFLRFGQVVGQSGLWYALLIIAASKAITTLTTLSLSAIATNTRVKGGGAYYLISRSLGVEFGGAIGVLFYLAQAISVAMYVIGFTEALAASVPAAGGYFVAIATLVNLVTFVCVYIGAGWTIKVQYFILATLIAAIASFSAGAVADFDVHLLQANMTPHFAEGESLFTMFALFFPAVTGIMAGANMSGDLESPSKSIPKGTLWAVVVTAVVYILQAVLLAGSRTGEQLNSHNMVIRDIAVFPLAITAGVYAATLSSALGSMMGAPRILQAFARDDIFAPLKFFAVGSGASGEPRRATVLTFLIAQVCILLGDLNAIAPIITMFFMITYGLLNFATFTEAVTKNPSYRPTFRFCHWSMSLLGFIGCLVVMFLMNPTWAIASIVVIAGLHWFIRSKEIESRWGDLRSGAAFERARRALLRLEEEAYHSKNWRPAILALSGTAWSRPHVAIYGHWLTAGHGVLTMAHIVSGDVEDLAERRNRFEASLRSFIAKEKLQAFPAVVVSRYLSDGIESLVQCHGIGGVRPNTVLLGWPLDETKADAFGANIRIVTRLGKSVIAARFLSQRTAVVADAIHGTIPVATETDPWEVPAGTIDVWWRGMKNGGLMMLLAHLLKQNPEWRRHEIRVLRVVDTEQAEDEVRQHIVDLCATARISAEPVVFTAPDPLTAIHRVSATASVVIFGLEVPEEGDEAFFFHRMEAVAGNLPRVLFVSSIGGMELES